MHASFVVFEWCGLQSKMIHWPQLPYVYAEHYKVKLKLYASLRSPWAQL